MAALGAARVGDRVVIVALVVCFGRRFILLTGRERDIREAAANDLEQQRVARLGITIDPRFMGELQPDAIVPDPAHRAFDLATLCQDQVDPLPQPRREVGADHRAAAR